MPFVRITLNEGINRMFDGLVAQDVRMRLRVVLRELVAEALNISNVEGAQLTGEDVGLQFEDGDPRNIGTDVEIIVLANHFVERERNINVRARHILDGIKESCDTIPGFRGRSVAVYVRLAPAGYASTEAR